MRKIRCEHCGRTLFLADYCKLEIKCPRCKKTIKIEIESTKAKSIGSTEE